MRGRLASIGRWGGLFAFALVATSAVAIFSTSQQVFADACTPNGRDCYRGYFTNAYDGGSGVLRNNVISTPAMLNVNNVSQLVANVRSHMVCSGGTLVNAGSQNATGAAFIVLTMLGYAPGTSKNVACQQLGLWETTVRSWAPYTRYNVFYDFRGVNTRSSVTDVAYYVSDQRQAWSIVFYHPTTGQPLYAIKKDCANPVGRLQALPRNYQLTPQVDSVSPNQIESGSKVSVTTSVNTTGQRNSQTTQWEITQITVQPGRKAPHEDAGATNSASAPCQASGGAPSGSHFQNADATCRNVAKGSGIFNLGSPSPNLRPSVSGLDVGDIPVGTRICFALSVQPRTNSDTRWAHSAVECTIAGKKPKVQVWGGDIYSRGRVEASTTVKTVDGSSQVFGSWVEYGVFSAGANSRVASGSGLNGQGQNEQAAWSKITFANVGGFGQFTTAARPQPNVVGFFSSIADKRPIEAEDVDLGSLGFNSGQPVHVHTAAGNVTITGGEIPAGRSVVIVADGTVTIRGNTTYSDQTLSSLRDIPQVVIIAQNILIEESVSRVDAWLVARETINTCSNVSGNLTSNKCTTLLEVNGPVIANRLLLNRTAGSGTGDASGDPAERFNLRPDAYLWSQLQAQGGSKAQTVYMTELPPRF